VAGQPRGDDNFSVGGADALTARHHGDRPGGGRNATPWLLSLRNSGAETFGYLWILLDDSSKQRPRSPTLPLNGRGVAEQRPGPRAERIAEGKNREHSDPPQRGITHPHLQGRTQALRPGSGQFGERTGALRRAALIHCAHCRCADHRRVVPVKERCAAGRVGPPIWGEAWARPSAVAMPA